MQSRYALNELGLNTNLIEFTIIEYEKTCHN